MQGRLFTLCWKQISHPVKLRDKRIIPNAGRPHTLQVCQSKTATKLAAVPVRPLDAEHLHGSTPPSPRQELSICVMWRNVLRLRCSKNSPEPNLCEQNDIGQCVRSACEFIDYKVCVIAA